LPLGENNVEVVGKRLTAGAVWTAGGRVVSNLLGLVSTLTVARLLTPADFGLVAIATVIFAIVQAVTELSLSSALIQHKDPQQGHYDTAFTLSICRSLAIAAVLAVAAFPLAAAYHEGRLVGICLMLGVTAFVSGLINPKLVVYRRRLSFHQEIYTDLINKFVGLVVAIAIAVTFHSYWALILGSLASQLALVAMSYVLIPYAPRFSVTHWRNLFSFSSWLALSSGLNALNYRADQLALGAMLGNGQLGQYTVGDNLASLPVRESTAPISNVLFPAFSRLQDDPARLREAFLRSQRMLVALALPIGVGFALVAGPFVSLVLGTQWTSAALVAQVLGAIFAVHAFSMPVTPLALGLGRTRLLFVRDIIFIAVRYPLIFLGLFFGGLLGLLLARCVSGTIGIAMDLYLARRLAGVGMWKQIASNGRPVAATIAMAAVVSVVGALSGGCPEIMRLALMIPAGGISYFGATLALWGASGKPAGPELTALAMLQLMRRRAVGY
jgi:O-antigen/teichoic acid export membrane protein